MSGPSGAPFGYRGDVDLRDKVALVTGASSGIGAATALAMAKAGMRVAVVARRADRLAQVEGLIRAQSGIAHSIVCDMAVPGHADKLLSEVESALGAVDVVFANAGYGLELTVAETSTEQLRRLFEVNLFAATDLLSESARRMRAANRRGHLLMCSSCVARYALPKVGVYAAAKAAQLSICQAMRAELEGAGIMVSSVHPIATETEFYPQMQSASGKELLAGEEFPLVPDHAPRLFVQSPEVVARAVVKCLRNPRPEVWTSFSARLAGAVFALSPRLHDAVMRRSQRRERRH